MVDKQIYKVNVIFNNERLQSVFEDLYLYDDNMSCKEIQIKVEDIKNIDMSICSS